MIQRPSCRCSPAVGGTTSDGEAIRSHCVVRVHAGMHLWGWQRPEDARPLVKTPHPATPCPIHAAARCHRASGGTVRAAGANQSRGPTQQRSITAPAVRKRPPQAHTALGPARMMRVRV